MKQPQSVPEDPHSSNKDYEAITLELFMMVFSSFMLFFAIAETNSHTESRATLWLYLLFYP